MKNSFWHKVYIWLIRITIPLNVFGWIMTILYFFDSDTFTKKGYKELQEIYFNMKLIMQVFK
jgi:hypothetical protein